MHNKTRNVFCTDKSQLLKYCLAHSRCLINIVEQLHLPFNMCAFFESQGMSQSMSREQRFNVMF